MLGPRQYSGRLDTLCRIDSQPNHGNKHSYEVNMIDSIINCKDILKADSIILTAGYDRTVSFGKGAKDGPQAIIKCLNENVEFFDRFTSTEYTEHYKFATKDLGISNDLLPEEMVEKVKTEYYQLINKKQFLMLLGGEHSVSIGALQAISEKFNPNEITFFQIDAHCNLRDSNFNACPDQSHISKYAHCCVARRAYEIGFHIVQVGIRSYVKEEHIFFSQNDKIVVFELSEGKTPSVDEIINSIKTDKVYISLDVDGIDPAHMPATGTPVQGGLDWYYTFRLLQELNRKKKIIGADIVEVAPIKNDFYTQYGAAQLCYHIIGNYLLKNKPRKALNMQYDFDNKAQNHHLNENRPLKKRFAELAVGLSVNQLIVWAFNFFLYPFVIYKFGILHGGVIMTFLSFITCILTLKLYDWSKRDWLGIEAIKSLKGYEGSKKIGQLTSWIMKKSDSVVFLFLSIKFDPFITTAYMRHSKFNGMNKRDWKVFTGSLIIGNAYWTLACYTGITLFEWVWRMITM